jgi:cytochrome c peroxidase
MKWVKTGLITAFCLLVLQSMNGRATSEYSVKSIATFRVDAQQFAASTAYLRNCITALQPGDTTAILAAKAALITCRNDYKRIEYFLDYFFEYPVSLYNRAPVYEIEEPFMEYQSPIGLQVVEDLLLDEDVYNNKKELADQCEVISSSAADIPALLYDLHPTDAQLLEAVRFEIIRVITLGITGYDAPQLKTGITESATAFLSIRNNLTGMFTPGNGGLEDSVFHYLDRGIALLESYPGFDGFDRLQFLTQAALPLQRCFGALLKSRHLDLRTHAALNNNADHLFSKDALDVQSFSGERKDKNDTALQSLGKALFFEKQLSGNGKRSCATCHQPDKFFTDGLIKSKTLDEKGEVSRNAPTLYYAAYQRMQFHDGRAGSLEEQISAVLQNPKEMDADLQKVVAWLNRDARYNQAFREAFQPAGPQDSVVTVRKLATALSAFEQTLAPFSSPFDAYLAGDRSAMNEAQIKGFNLFMGKAQCGSCHFAPLFNGLLPPYYERTELEVLGVPQRGNVRRPKADTDSGRYSFFAISFNNGAFKTSTVRNSAMTAPYMHNGAFKTLKEVIDFYNKGGGKGLKLAIENQTLSDKPLALTRKEIQNITAFLEALTDKPDSSRIQP